MSSVSVTSNNREKDVQELKEELEAVLAMNNYLRTYLDNIRIFKRNLAAMNSNCKQLSKVNSQWIDVISNMK